MALGPTQDKAPTQDHLLLPTLVLDQVVEAEEEVVTATTTAEAEEAGAAVKQGGATTTGVNTVLMQAQPQALDSHWHPMLGPRTAWKLALWDKKRAPLPPMLTPQRTPVGLMESKVKTNSPACHLHWIKKSRQEVRLHWRIKATPMEMTMVQETTGLPALDGWEDSTTGS